MERERVEAESAVQSIVDILPVLAVQPYIELIGAGAVLRSDAVTGLNRLADILEAMQIPAPFVGYAVAKAIREYAAAFEKSPRGEPPSLEIIAGGKGGGDT